MITKYKPEVPQLLWELNGKYIKLRLNDSALDLIKPKSDVEIAVIKYSGSGCHIGLAFFEQQKEYNNGYAEFRLSEKELQFMFISILIGTNNVDSMINDNGKLLSMIVADDDCGYHYIEEKEAYSDDELLSLDFGDEYILPMPDGRTEFWKHISFRYALTFDNYLVGNVCGSMNIVETNLYEFTYPQKAECDVDTDIFEDIGGDYFENIDSMEQMPMYELENYFYHDVNEARI